MASTNGRSYHTQQTHYIRARLTIAALAGGADVNIGTLPAGALRAQDTIVHVVTTLDTNAQLKLGSSGDAGFLHDAITCTSGKQLLTTGSFVPLTSDMNVLATLTSGITSGAFPTTGEIEVILFYVPNNDNLDRTTQFNT